MTKFLRDRQRNRCYRWEDKNVSPYDRNIVTFEYAESIVKYVWSMEDLTSPPLVEKLAKQNRHGGTGSRLSIHLPEHTHTWIILHELAHAMSSTHDGKSNLHGSLFMGNYIRLLQKYLHLSMIELVRSAEGEGLRVRIDAKPVFLD